MCLWCDNVTFCGQIKNQWINSFILELFLIPIAAANSCHWKGFVCEILRDLYGWQFFFKNHSKCLYQSGNPSCHFHISSKKKSIFNIVMLLYHLTDIDLKHTAIKLFTGCLSCCSFLPFWNYWPCLVANVIMYPMHVLLRALDSCSARVAEQ